MKTKHSVAVLVIVLSIITNGFTVTIGNWQGAPAGDANKPAGKGSWKDAYWNKPPAAIPAGPSIQANEIKIIKPNTSCTVDSNVGSYICKLSIGGGTDLATSPILEIANGGFLGIGEARIGSGGSASTGAIGSLVQTGGTLILSNKLFLGRYGTSNTNPNEGKGYFTISGGTLAYSQAVPDAGAMYIGASGSGGVSEGIFTIVGKQAKINLRKLYIGGDGKKSVGNGTVEFKLQADGVSPIKVAEGVSLDLGGEQSKAVLNISADAAAPKADILLVDNTASNPITGIFDTVNGIAAAEGAQVAVKTNSGISNYILTYKGGNGNDISLKFVKFTAADANAGKK